jgi:hypothetical protein
MAPSSIIELWIEEDRLPIEVGDEGGVDFAAIDRLQNRDHGFRRIEATDVDMDSALCSPHPGFFLRSSAGHDDTSLLPFIDKLVPQYLIISYELVSRRIGNV